MVLVKIVRYLTFCSVIGNIFTIMKTKHKPNPEEFFSTTPVFTLQSFADYYGKNRLSDASNILKYHRRKGRIVNISRTIYAVVPYGANAEVFEPDRYLVAAAARDNGIFCYHAALELLGFSHSIWKDCTVFCTLRHKNINMRNSTIRFLGTPSPLKACPDIGTSTIIRKNVNLLVTGRERTLIEGFRKPYHSGGLEKLVVSASGFGVLDLDLLIRVLEVYNQKNLWAAVGWFLNQNMEQFGITSSYLNQFEQKKPISPQYLPGTYGNGSLDKRWNIILPDNLPGKFEGHAT